MMAAATTFGVSAMAAMPRDVNSRRPSVSNRRKNKNWEAEYSNLHMLYTCIRSAQIGCSVCGRLCTPDVHIHACCTHTCRGLRAHG